MNSARLYVAWVSVLLSATGCGDADSNITPAGAGSGTGQQGGSVGSGGEGAQSSGNGAEGGGVAGDCEPGTVIACYTGPAGTEDVGACLAGSRTCNTDGLGYGPCEGQTLPAPETCNTPVDDDCDGEVNEAGAGCICTPNASTYCYTGPPTTENQGICVGGIKTCNDQGTAYGPCAGEQVPEVVDDCATPLLDEDCDGETPACPADWTVVFGDASAQLVHTVAVDTTGNTFVGGEFAGSITLGATVHTSAGLQDAFVAKIDPAGAVLWSKQYGNADIQAVLGVATDGNGDVIVTGYVRGTINFGTSTLTSAGGADIFVAKLSGADGSQVWAARYGSSTDDQVGTAVAVDSQNAVYVTGYFTGTINFGGGNRVSAGLTDAFALKLNSAGVHQWSQRYGNAHVDVGRDVATTATDGVMLVGDFFGSVDLGGGAITSVGKSDIYTAVLDSAGTHVWSAGFGDAGFQFARAVTRGPNGPIVAGEMEGTVDFGGSVLSSAGAFDGMLVELDETTGALLSGYVFGGAGDDSVLDVAYDPSGFIVLTGYTSTEIDFGAGPLFGAGGRDGFIAKIDAAGGAYWARTFGDETFYQQATSVAVDATSDLRVGGHFSGTVDLGAGATTSAGSTDAFVAFYPP